MLHLFSSTIVQITVPIIGEKKLICFTKLGRTFGKQTNKLNRGTSHPFDEVPVCIQPLKESSIGEQQFV
jgi:hypothetical protein